MKVIFLFNVPTYGQILLTRDITNACKVEESYLYSQANIIDKQWHLMSRNIVFTVKSVNNNVQCTVMIINVSDFSVWILHYPIIMRKQIKSVRVIMCHVILLHLGSFFGLI